MPACASGMPLAFGGQPMDDASGFCNCCPQVCALISCPPGNATFAENGGFPEQDGTFPMSMSGMSSWETSWSTAGSDYTLGGFYMWFSITCKVIDNALYWVFSFFEQQTFYVGEDAFVVGPCSWTLQIPRPIVGGIQQACPPSGTYTLSPAGSCAIDPVPGFAIGPITVTF